MCIRTVFVFEQLLVLFLSLALLPIPFLGNRDFPAGGVLSRSSLRNMGI